jgi:hypothetical protein
VFCSGEFIIMGQALQIKSEPSRNPVATIGNVRHPTFEAVATSCKWLPALAKNLWPTKPAPALHYLTGAPERTCYEWMRGRVDPPSRALVTLLQSDQGWRVLSQLMRDSKQHWWTETVNARERSRSDEKDQLQLL